MKAMKKWIAALLCAALTVSLCACASSEPTAANGETVITLKGDSASVKGGGASAKGSTVSINTAGTYRISGSLSDGSILVDTGEAATEVTLILDGVDICCLTAPTIHIKQAKDARLVLADGTENVLVSGTAGEPLAAEASGAALYCEDDLDIDGGGALSVLGNINNGIGCKKDLDINGGTIAVTAVNNGIRGVNSVEIKGGAVSVNAANDGVKSTATDKPGKGYVSVSGGVLTVAAQGDGVSAATELSITDGTVSISANGDGAAGSSKALKAGGALSISGGTLQLASLSSTAVSGDGDITVSGGELAISAAKRGFNAGGSFQITGGTVLALVGSKKDVSPAPGGQSYACAQLNGSAGDSVTVSAGQELASGTAATEYAQVFFSSPEAEPGTAYSFANQQRTVSAVGK